MNKTNKKNNKFENGIDHIIVDGFKVNSFALNCNLEMLGVFIIMLFNKH